MIEITIPDPQRPAMKDYGVVSDRSGLLEWAWVREQLTEARNYWICTTRPNGKPHAAPVWGVVLGDVVTFGTSATSVKARNLRANHHLVLHLESGDDCVIIEGMALPVTDEKTLLRMATGYGEKYPSFQPAVSELRTNANYAVQPVVVMAWKESDFPNTATRWVFTSA